MEIQFGCDTLDSENPFEELALAYNNTIDWTKRLQREMPFLQQSLVNARGRVLDLACGTGKHVIALAEKGVSAVGLDISERMIESAKEKSTSLGLDITWIVDDMVKFPSYVEPPFDLVLCLGNSLALMDDMSSVKRLLKSVQGILAPDRYFVFQVLNGNFISKNKIFLIPQKAGHLNTGERVVFSRFFNIREDSEPFELVLSSFIEQKEGWNVSTSYQSVLNIHDDEIINMLDSSGFTSTEIFSDYNKSAFDSDMHQNMVVRAKS